MGLLMQEGAAGLRDVASFAFRGFGDNLVALWILKNACWANQQRGCKKDNVPKSLIVAFFFFLPLWLMGSCV